MTARNKADPSSFDAASTVWLMNVMKLRSTSTDPDDAARGLSATVPCEKSRIDGRWPHAPHSRTMPSRPGSVGRYSPNARCTM